MPAMTFLQHCQKAASKSGVIDGPLPITVVSQVGDLAKIVGAVAEAWRRIQLANDGWLWMRKEWTGTITSPIARYTATGLGITNFGRWYNEAPYSGYRNITIHDPVVGLSDENEINEITWEQYRQIYLRGVQELNRPRHYAISPSNELCVGQPPDKDYVLAGEYFTAVQDLTLDADVPALPAAYHDMIWNLAVVIFSEDDEAFKLSGIHMQEYERLNAGLVRTQLPPMKTAFRPMPVA